MGHPSTPEFTTFHALRIKGFATVDTLVDMTELAKSEIESHLTDFADHGYVQFRENRELWQLTPDGRAAHTDLLEVDLEGFDAASELEETYPAFVDINIGFKELCGDWQLRNGEPNDHSDADYDAEVIARLVEMHETAQPLIRHMGDVLDRLAIYADRLDAALAKVQAGQTTMFTGVMCDSYHDIWMELHEDLILTQAIDRAAEGSF